MNLHKLEFDSDENNPHKYYNFHNYRIVVSRNGNILPNIYLQIYGIYIVNTVTFIYSTAQRLFSSDTREMFSFKAGNY